MPRLLDTNENTRGIVWHLINLEMETETYTIHAPDDLYTQITCLRVLLWMPVILHGIYTKSGPILIDHMFGT